MLHAKFQDHRTSYSGEDFYIWVWQPSCSCVYNFFPPSQGGLSCNFALIDQVVLQMKRFENGGHIIHVYSPGAGVDNPLV